VEASILWRNLIRWLAVVCGVLILMERAPEAIYSYQKWHQLANHDPSHADFYRKVFFGEMIVGAIAVSAGQAIFTGLRQKKEPRRGTSGGSIPK
jgi:hypothetical protein